MRTVLKYTVQPGDTIVLIALSIRACAGVSIADIVKANHGVELTPLPEHILIKIPYYLAGGHFEYQTRVGDSITSICEGLANAASLTVLDLINHNYAISKHKASLDLSKLNLNQVLSVPYSPALHVVTAIP
ncbi:LysM domain-containing protein [Pseudoalteromonas sp.]|jgi:phage tail protein X|uniref:LysM peptidoglycan-binding domain-containing protein n=1 Tax=Pseudoalteromonas sp. TaxID=53249 RepID=UPI00235558BE|nr:LysM domain-containing protein [Pseudoalteromonas sp.]